MATYTVEIPGYTVTRVEGDRVQLHHKVGGVTYHGMDLDQVQAINRAFGAVVAELNKLGDAHVAAQSGGAPGKKVGA